MRCSKRKTEEAKKKLKAHLIRYKNDSDFVATRKRAQYWFNVINKAVFKNKLPQPYAIKVKRIHGHWGVCIIDTKDRIEIQINESIGSRDLFIATIAHEMVHQWQLISQGRMNHTSSYLRWKRYFKRHFDIIL